MKHIVMYFILKYTNNIFLFQIESRSEWWWDSEDDASVEGWRRRLCVADAGADTLNYSYISQKQCDQIWWRCEYWWVLAHINLVIKYQ